LAFYESVIEISPCVVQDIAGALTKIVAFYGGVMVARFFRHTSSADPKLEVQFPKQ
jgi:hypothetical protein